MTSRCRARLAATLVALAASGSCAVAGPMSLEDGYAAQARCFEDLAKGRARDVVCEYPTLLRDEERAELVKLTLGYLKDARCIVSIRIERARVAQAVFAPDLVFEVPPQPVKCEIETSASVVAITATFAPRVVMKGGEAVEATPNLANVAGVNNYVARPVVEYINRSKLIRDRMLRMINQYRNMAAAARRASLH